MSTLTPTSEGLGPVSGLPPPAGLPDLGALAALANAFFTALPGETPALPPPAAGADAQVPPLAGVTLSPQAPSTGAIRPTGGPVALAPASVPGGLTPPRPPSGATPLQAAPRVTQQDLPQGVPQDHPHGVPPGVPDSLGRSPTGLPGVSAALPQIGAPAAPTEAPFYFVAEALRPASTAPAQVPAVDDRVSPQAFGLPGAEALRALLSTPSHGAAAPAAPAQTASGYYFLSPPAPPTAQDAPRFDRGRAAFDVHAVRRDFPILQERVNGRPLVWFDNAATTQKPQAVIDRLAHFYAHENSNIHRAAHALAARATDAYEGARETVRRFIGASSTDEVIFVRGTTEAINLIAKSWGAKHIHAGDEIIVSHLEHHANIVPWQQLAAETGAVIRVIPVDDHGQVILSAYQRLLGPRTKLVAVTQVSNALGTVVPVREIVALAHAAGARTLVDGAQSISHMKVDVQALDTDFFVFSGHKIFGPTGIGVVYGKRVVLEDMPPWQGGGNMIADVTFEKTIYHGPPTRFEAGTGNIADAVGLAAALEYVERIGIETIGRYEHDLLAYATHHLQPIPGVRLVGTAADKASVLSFVLDGYSTHEVGQALNDEGIAVRTGHHCAQPILRRFGLEATVRPSLAFYNTCEEVDRFITVIRRLAGQRR